MMVNELQEEKKMMEELVRSSMTPVSESTSPHPGNEADSVAPSQEVEASQVLQRHPGNLWRWKWIPRILQRPKLPWMQRRSFLKKLPRK